MGKKVKHDDQTDPVSVYSFMMMQDVLVLDYISNSQMKVIIFTVKNSHCLGVLHYIHTTEESICECMLLKCACILFLCSCDLSKQTCTA